MNALSSLRIAITVFVLGLTVAPDVMAVAATPAIPTSVLGAVAIVGRPATPMSVAGVARRSVRRNY